MDEWHPPIHVGDMVTLTSGGPLMRVECELDQQKVWCTWRGTNGIEGLDFNRSSLKPAPTMQEEEE